MKEIRVYILHCLLRLRRRLNSKQLNLFLQTLIKSVFFFVNLNKYEEK